MTIINEEWARRAKENMSFSDYKPGSATASYNAHIADVTAKIKAAKAKVSPEAQERLDSLLERYKVKYAEWLNNYNRNGAGHVSVMISGASNYNMRAHEKYLNREGKLWKEYEELNIDHKISAIIHGDKIIKSGDADAIEKLEAKIAKLEKYQTDMKAANAIVRKKKLTDEEKINQLIELLGIENGTAAKLLQPDFCGRVGFPDYALTNNGATIRTSKKRLEGLQRLAEQAATAPIEERTVKVNGIEIIDNIEINRVQIIFPGKPDADIRAKLKSNGFKWAPSQGAWQNYRSERALRIAQEVASCN